MTARPPARTSHRLATRRGEKRSTIRSRLDPSARNPGIIQENGFTGIGDTIERRRRDRSMAFKTVHHKSPWSAF